MTENIVASTERDSLDFVSTNDGNAGMSASALSRFCGVPRSSLRDLLDKAVGGNTGSKSLESLRGGDIYLAERGIKNERYLKAEVCSKIIMHYAFHAKKTTEEAKHSVEKFAEKGVKEWIHELTGHKKEKYNLAKDFIKPYARVYKPEFPKEFYDELYRVTGYTKSKKVHNPYTAVLIREYVYGMFGQEVLDEIDRVNPIIGYVIYEVPKATPKEILSLKRKINGNKMAVATYTKGGKIWLADIAKKKIEKLTAKLQRIQKPHSIRLPKRAYKHHQFCSDLMGLPSLQAHLQTMISVMRTLPADNTERFHEAMAAAFPNGALKNVNSVILDLPAMPE